MIFQVFYYPGYLKRGHNLSVLLQNPVFYNQLKHQRLFLSENQNFWHLQLSQQLRQDVSPTGSQWYLLLPNLPE
ncbi:hypothetical protein D3C71_1045730 [compost metagenome]